MDISESYISKNQLALDVLHYNLKFDLHPAKKLLDGDVIISGFLKDSLVKRIDLNFYDNFNIKKVTLNNNVVNDYSYTGTSFSVPVSFSVLDTFNLRIIYEGTPRKLGFGSFAFGNFNGSSVIYSLSEPVYASTWYPCNDRPDDKALLDMYITNDSEKVSVSNGKLIDITNNGNKRTYHWKTFYPISTYLICIYSANYKNFTQNYWNIDNKKIDLEYYAFPEHLEMAKIDFSDHPEIMRFYENKFGVYPFIMEKYGVAEFLWQYGAMEHQTITGIGSNFVTGKKMFNEYYIHELAHQWWGDAVGLKTWKDIWLNEGFASYCEALYYEHQAGFSALKSTMLSKFSKEFYGTLYDPDYLFGSTVYNKGAWVLHMLRFEIGDSVFFSVLREYYNKYRYSNASTFDFQKVCEYVSGKDLNDFFNQWVYKGKGIINLIYNYNIETVDNKNKIKIIINQTQKGYDIYKFPLQILIKSDQNEMKGKFYITKREQKIELPANGKVKDIIIDPDNWLLAKTERDENLK